MNFFTSPGEILSAAPRPAMSPKKARVLHSAESADSMSFYEPYQNPLFRVLARMSCPFQATPQTSELCDEHFRLGVRPQLVLSVTLIRKVFGTLRAAGLLSFDTTVPRNSMEGVGKPSTLKRAIA